jgi:hypothetical protein
VLELTWSNIYWNQILYGDWIAIFFEYRSQVFNGGWYFVA